MNKMNNHHHKVNKVSKHTFAPAISETNNIITRKTGQINYNFQTKITKKVINHNHKIKFLYIGNLDQTANEEDLYELFGLRSTKYLSENSYIDFVMDEQTGKSKAHTFVTVPTHIKSSPAKTLV